MIPSEIFEFRKLNWQDYYRAYTTPREWKKGARDIPFGQGAKSLYVDGANGHDHNDGESWKTAFKTIQSSLDTAESWTTIFINPGTYSEYVEITQNNISLIGASSDSVIITLGSYPSVIRINGNFCSLSNFKILIPEGNVNWGIIVDQADHFSADACVFERIDIANYAISLIGSRSSVVSNCVFSKTWDGIVIPEEVDISRFCSFYNNFFSSNGGTAVSLFTASLSSVFNNNFSDCGKGVNCLLDSGYNSIFHNNFFNSPLRSSSASDHFFENFYSTHSNIDNGFGIATEPYFSSGAWDPRPVVCSSGWNNISIQRSLLRKKTGAQATQVAVDANGTTWVDLKSISPTTSDLELYSIQMTAAGTWTGTAKFRIIVGTTKVYPFAADADISSGTPVIFLFPINVQINETVKIQFRSDNAGDGAGETVALDQLDYAQVV